MKKSLLFYRKDHQSKQSVCSRREQFRSFLILFNVTTSIYIFFHIRYFGEFFGEGVVGDSRADKGSGAGVLRCFVFGALFLISDE